MLDEIGRRIETARHHDLVVGDFRALEILPFVGMARVGRLEQKARRARPHRGGEDRGKRDVVGMRPLVIAPADVHAHCFGRDVAGRMVERGNVALGNAEEFRVGEVLVLVMAGRAEVGRIDLQDEAGAVDGFVFLRQRVGQRFDIGIFVLVEAVGHEFCQHAGRGGVHERLDRA